MEIKLQTNKCFAVKKKKYVSKHIQIYTTDYWDEYNNFS